jgi:hypothetical protein
MQERHFLQTETAAWAISAGQFRLSHLRFKHALELFGLVAEVEDLASVQPNALTTLADVDQYACFGHRFNE